MLDFLKGDGNMSVTIKDIAKLAEVSTTTVSKIINGKDKDISQKTKEKVKSIISEYNYVPSNVARSMITKKSRTIGLIIPDVRNPFFTDLVRGVEDMAESNDYNVFFCNTDEKFDKEIKSINAMTEKMVDGMIIVPAVHRSIEYEKNINIKIPVVTIDRNANYKNIISSIATNNYSGAYEAVKYLIDNGHKKIAFISGPIDILPSVERKKGFLDACYDNDIQISDEDIYIGKFDISWGDEVIENMDLKYTAFFCGNDLIAAGVIRTLLKKGYKVPEDVSVIGFDDIYLARCIHPELTTVRQESYKIGSTAAKILINFLEKIDTENKNITLDSKLIVRESTGRMNNHE